jgi:dTDP-glucose pyrophosphorylase/CBS domain-containing protein
MAITSGDPETRLKRVIISPQTPIVEAIKVLDDAGIGILLLCGPDRRLTGVITDGDIRRAILHRVPFEKPCLSIAVQNPLVASPGLSRSEALHLMDHGKNFKVNHLPIVNADGQVTDLLIRSDLTIEEPTLVQAVLMAGGYGTRLHPLTTDIPKPMLHVGGRPIMEWIINGLSQAGIRDITVTTHYKAKAITDYFGDGSKFGVHIEYVHEEKPSGTAGALRLIEPWQQPLLVMNCDILTRVNFRAMLSYHLEHKADMTVAVRDYHIQVPYGIVEMDDMRIRELTEKPSLPFLVNAGIYLLQPLVQDYITKGESLDIPVLIERLLNDDRLVAGFPVREYWIDIGEHVDYEQAQDDVHKWRF